jgi:hypothetical protein
MDFVLCKAKRLKELFKFIVLWIVHISMDRTAMGGGNEMPTRSKHLSDEFSPFCGYCCVSKSANTNNFIEIDSVAPTPSHWDFQVSI